MDKFWNFKSVSDELTEMRIDGIIANETWWGDEVTPKLFKDELKTHENKDLTIWINSEGGDVFAAAEIYNAIKERKGNTTVKIDSIAASAASVIAMAGDVIEMSPVAIMMIHKPSTISFGNADDMRKTAEILDEVQATIKNAYQLKTGMSDRKLNELINKETYMNAYTAYDLKFIDKVMYDGDDKPITNKLQFNIVNNDKYIQQIVAKLNIKNEEPKEDIIPEKDDIDASAQASNKQKFYEKVGG